MFRVILSMGPSIYAGPVIGDQLCNIFIFLYYFKQRFVIEEGRVIHVENAYLHFGY